MKPVEQLKKGDKVNGHEKGFMIVVDIEKDWRIRVLYNTQFGYEWIVYFPHEQVETI